MFIHEMTREECSDALERANFGRLAFTRDNQPYVVLSTSPSMAAISTRLQRSDKKWSGCVPIH